MKLTIKKLDKKFVEVQVMQLLQHLKLTDTKLCAPVVTSTKTIMQLFLLNSDSPFKRLFIWNESKNQPKNSDSKTYENIKNVSSGWRDDFKIGCRFDYLFFYGTI